LAALQQAVSDVDESCMRRVHGTTGEPPADRLIREREALQPLPSIAFDPRVPETRRVLSDCVVSFQGALYSVPYVHVGSRVTVKADPLGNSIEIFAGADRIADHLRAKKGERRIVDEHVAELRRPRFERLRARASRSTGRAARRPLDLLSPIQWPCADVEQRPIEEYARVVGGVR
jgi:hypothetical protein